MLRYAPPIYTVIRRGIIFVFINILNILILLLLSIIIILLLSSVINNVSYSRLRIYCLIHTPLSPLVSPLSVCQPPRRGTVRHPYPRVQETLIW